MSYPIGSMLKLAFYEDDNPWYYIVLAEDGKFVSILCLEEDHDGVSRILVDYLNERHGSNGIPDWYPVDLG